MQLRQLRNFIAVAELGSFSAAARSLYTAQSTLSQSVSKLECELGLPLLLRGHDGVSLTPFGQMVYEDVRQTLSRLDSCSENWQRFIDQRSSLRGSLRLAAVSCVHAILEQLVIPQLNVNWPNLHCSAQESRCQGMLSALWEGKVDLSLYTCPDDQLPQLEQAVENHGLQLLPLRKDSYRLAVSTRGPLGTLETLSAHRAKQLPLACYTDGDEVADAFFARGFDPALTLEFNSFEKIVGAALAGHAAAVLPELATSALLLLSGRGNALRFLTLDGFDVPFTHYLLFRKSDACQPGIPQTADTVQQVFSQLE